jgi:archaetidylserine synthase
MTGIFRLIRTADVVSILNAALGFGSIIMAAEGRYVPSAVLIFLALAADGLDGFLARKAGDGPLGTQIDSLADVISFGAAPAFLAWAAFGSIFSLLGAVYLACGILRLARFNVSPKSRDEFSGIPIPGAGAMVAASIFLDGPPLTALLLVLTSFLMISTIPYPKFRDPRLILPALAVGAAAATAWLLGHLRISAGVAFLALVGYLVSPLVIELCRRRGKRPPSRRG